MKNESIDRLELHINGVLSVRGWSNIFSQSLALSDSGNH